MGLSFFVDLGTGGGSDSFLGVKSLGVNVILDSTDQVLIILLMVIIIVFGIIIFGIIVVDMIFGTVLSFGWEGIHVIGSVLKWFVLVFVIIMGVSNILVTRLYVRMVR
jgi:hypothetical protein